MFVPVGVCISAYVYTFVCVYSCVYVFTVLYCTTSKLAIWGERFGF